MGDCSQPMPVRSARPRLHMYSSPPENSQPSRQPNESCVGTPGMRPAEAVAIGTVLSRDQLVHSTVPRTVSEFVIFWRTLAVTEPGSGTVASKLTPSAAGTRTGINPNGGTMTGAVNAGRKMLPLTF